MPPSALVLIGASGVLRRLSSAIWISSLRSLSRTPLAISSGTSNAGHLAVELNDSRDDEPPGASASNT